MLIFNTIFTNEIDLKREFIRNQIKEANLNLQNIEMVHNLAYPKHRIDLKKTQTMLLTNMLKNTANKTFDESKLIINEEFQNFVCNIKFII